LAGPVRRGEILTDVRLIGADGPDPGPGRVAVPVHPDDSAVVGLVRPGMHIGLVGVTADGDVRALTGDAVVLSVQQSTSGSEPGALVVVGVPRSAADAVTAMALTGHIGLRFG
jgi:hypothetical protein